MGLRLAFVRLISTPLFTIFSVISLAAGVAVTTAVYSVVDTLILSDSGVRDPARAAVVVTSVEERAQRGSVSDPDFEDLRRRQTAFRTMTAAAVIQPAVAATGNAEITNVEAVDSAYFGTVGVGAALGRVLLPADDAARSRVAVLSDEFWRSRLAADPNVIGREIRLNGQAFEVIGVAPARYRGIFGALFATRLWIPLSTEAVVLGPKQTALPARERQRLLVIGRLAEDRTIADASAELRVIGADLDREYPARSLGLAPPSQRRWSAKSIAGISIEDTALRRFGMLIVWLVGLVLLVACTNLANLVLARGTARQGELAVRMALGASRGRLIWEQCVESLILAVAGAAASYLMFQAVSAFMTMDFVLPLPTGGSTALSIRPSINAQAVTVAAVALLLSLAVFGLEPAVQLTRQLDIRSALAATATGIRPRVRRQRMVIRWQVAIAAGFFIVATMFIRETINQARHDSGVDVDRLAVAVLQVDTDTWDETRVRRTIDRVMENGRIAGIEQIAASTGLPFGVPALQVAITIPEDQDAFRRDGTYAVAVTPSGFSTLGVSVVRGRRFDDRDGPSGRPVVILSELASRQLFGQSDAVGRTVIVRRPGAAATQAMVVGVARDTDVRSMYRERRSGLVYLPLAQQFARGITITARSTGAGAAAVPALREAIRRADPDLPVATIGSGWSILAGPFVLIQSLGRGALYLGGLTLLLSMVGLFGVQSHVVSHRTREIGVRMSVGATATQIKLMVLKDGYRPVIEGLVLGLWAGLAGRLILRSYLELEDVTIIDPWMLVLTPIPLIAAAFCACYLPASRAAAVEPSVALRSE